jgi:PEGA domain
MNSHTRYLRIRVVTALGLAALMLVLALPAARAETTRTGTEPWYQQSNADARLQAQALFAQAVSDHQQLLRDDATERYEQALALWDNPDIRWNLALVLEDLGQFLRAHEQLESTLHWEAALGVERLRDVRGRIQRLETQHLASIKISCDEPGADIKLDGHPWFRGPERQSTLVMPGEHYISATKTGYFPVTRSVVMKAGQEVRVALPMDVDRLIEARRWSAWKPWVMASAGVAVTAVGVGIERQAFVHRDAAAAALRRACLLTVCSPIHSPEIYNRAVMDSRLAIGVFLAGGSAAAVGLTLAWLNQLHMHRTEARPPAPIEITPLVSADQAGLSALLRF